MKIIWNKVTLFSQMVAIVLFVFIFVLGIILGRMFGISVGISEGSQEGVVTGISEGISTVLGSSINNVKFKCENGKSIHAVFYKNAVHVVLSSSGDFLHEVEYFLPQTISASGARYANNDESVVFWNKGDTAFMTQGDPNTQTYSGCLEN